MNQSLRRTGGSPFPNRWQGAIAVLVFAAFIGCRRHEKQELAPLDELTTQSQSKDADDRYMAVKELGKRAPNHTEAVPMLIAALSDKDENVRYIATEGLSRFGKAAAESIPRLTELLRDRSPVVRTGAATALGNMGEAAVPALEALSAATRDANQDVRGEATRAITTIKQAKHFQELNRQPAQ
jgi:HEAT repeat protein